MIKNSDFACEKQAQDFDARVKFSIPKMEGRTSPACRCGDVLQGKCRPTDCKVFGKVVTPLHPIGACMVSNEEPAQFIISIIAGENNFHLQSIRYNKL